MAEPLVPRTPPARGVPHTLDRTCWELGHSGRPWTQSPLYRVATAVQEVRQLETHRAAVDLIWDRVEALGGARPAGPTMRRVLELEGIDVAAVMAVLERLDHEHHIQQQQDEEAKVRRAFDSSMSEGLMFV